MWDQLRWENLNVPVLHRCLEHGGGFAFARQWVTFGGREGWNRRGTSAVKWGKQKWCSVSCFCYSVIPIKLWINQQVLRSRGGQPPNLSSYMCFLSHILLWSVSGSNFVCSCHGKTSLLSPISSLILTLSEKVGRSVFVWPCLSVRA